MHILVEYDLFDQMSNQTWAYICDRLNDDKHRSAHQGYEAVHVDPDTRINKSSVKFLSKLDFYPKPSIKLLKRRIAFGWHKDWTVRITTRFQTCRSIRIRCIPNLLPTQRANSTSNQPIFAKNDRIWLKLSHQSSNRIVQCGSMTKFPKNSNSTIIILSDQFTLRRTKSLRVYRN